jgi:hypothetical protein
MKPTPRADNEIVIIVVVHSGTFPSFVFRFSLVERKTKDRINSVQYYAAAGERAFERTFFDGVSLFIRRKELHYGPA